MCGRHTNQYTWRELHALYSLSDLSFPTSNFEPKYNIAPTQTAPVVRLEDGKREIVFMRWGLVPSWAKDDKGGAIMINAKSETVAEMPALKSAFLRRRCLVIANGLLRVGEGDAEGEAAALHHHAGSPSVRVASLWEWWKPRDGSAILETFAILTTEPNSLCAPIHDRMPVMLGEDAWPAWLGEVTVTSGDLLKLQRPFPVEKMERWPVGKAVGKVNNEGPELIERVAS